MPPNSPSPTYISPRLCNLDIQIALQALPTGHMFADQQRIQVLGRRIVVAQWAFVGRRWWGWWQLVGACLTERWVGTGWRRLSHRIIRWVLQTNNKTGLKNGEFRKQVNLFIYLIATTTMRYRRWWMVMTTARRWGVVSSSGVDCGLIVTRIGSRVGVCAGVNTISQIVAPFDVAEARTQWGTASGCSGALQQEATYRKVREIKCVSACPSHFGFDFSWGIFELIYLYLG